MSVPAGAPQIIVRSDVVAIGYLPLGLVWADGFAAIETPRLDMAKSAKALS
ncbi:hypothetical protein COLAER_01025 [Collinsella aerofaciens ATCC 25986]|uniref:Uncharacterized protein n=1 Tax=Collinsella aerofaciens (strain ATCC 25986 / DSM 3979 / JCM 10188 / KCTC 3647 / NCTC 11838 / VPI 1003) TaxID=411903 RepID=A4E9D1_COLAA|nr:hypothetical protein COLAER_01025 [Collinsella aerofaciens ATCC 25986]